MLEETVWYERYKPRTLDDCLLPEKTRKQLKKYIKSKDIPNIIMSGPPGIGKTTTARVLCEQIGAEYIKIPASLKGNIDTLRTEIQQFASTMSFNGIKKYVILDEADYLTAATQAAFRGFLDEYSTNCGFIFTCNYREKILEPIADSRLAEASFVFTNDERPQLAKGVYAMLAGILEKESVVFDPKNVQKFVIDTLKRNSDIRRLLNTAQKASLSGFFEVSELESTLSERFRSLTDALKSRSFTQARIWVGENSDIDPQATFRYLFDNAEGSMSSDAVNALIIILGDYQYKHALVADPEVNLAACVTRIILECYPR